jgi:hypothetical protein
MTTNPRPPDECAQCGAAIPRRAKACPGCGAYERTGWRETSVYDDLNLPDSAYADEPASPPLRRGLPWYFVVAAILGILAALVFSLGGR